MPITWSDEVDDVLAGDMTVGLAYLTPARGVVIIPMSPLGIRNRVEGTVTLSSTIAFPKKIDRIRRNPSLALAYHAREHGFSSRPEYVLVQGNATVGGQPDREWLESITPEWERFFGPRRSGVLGRLLDVYYWQRIAITIDVHRIIVVDPKTEQSTVLGAPLPTTPPPSQPPPKNGTGPRVDSAKAAANIARLPHTLLGWVGTDGFPMVVPVTSATADQHGLHLQTQPDLLPLGRRRAGLLAHMFHPRSVGWEQRGYTGWLNVDDAGARYAPHTAFGLATSPSKRTFEVVTAIVTNALARKGRKQAVIR